MSRLRSTKRVAMHKSIINNLHTFAQPQPQPPSTFAVIFRSKLNSVEYYALLNFIYTRWPAKWLRISAIFLIQ